MRIYSSPVVTMDGHKPGLAACTGLLHGGLLYGNVSACAKFPTGRSLLPQLGLVDAITPDQIFRVASAARLLRSDGGATGTAESIRHSI
jgi:hypothetical protein